MKSIHCLWSIAILSVLVIAPGCSGGREVEVTGEAKAAASVTLTGPISIEFFEVPAEGATEEAASIKKIELAQAGEFTETVDVEGDLIRVFALNDVNKDGACNDGEPWAESQATVKEDGSVDRLTLELSTAACPLPQ
jgi:hypothetical protein